MVTNIIKKSKVTENKFLIPWDVKLEMLNILRDVTNYSKHLINVLDAEVKMHSKVFYDKVDELRDRLLRLMTILEYEDEYEEAE